MRTHVCLGLAVLTAAFAAPQPLPAGERPGRVEIKKARDHIDVLVNGELAARDHIDLTAGVAPVVFGDTKEGAMGVRVHDQMREQKGNGRLTNAEGKVGEKDCWGQFSAWCDYSGTVNGKKVGVTIFDDPKNPHPAA